jgi:hypothetical protein
MPPNALTNEYLEFLVLGGDDRFVDDDRLLTQIDKLPHQIGQHNALRDIDNTMTNAEQDQNCGLLAFAGVMSLFGVAKKISQI